MECVTGMSYGIPGQNPRSTAEREMSEPFSLNLDLLWNPLTQEPKVMFDSGEKTNPDKENNEVASTRKEGQGVLRVRYSTRHSI